MSELMGNNKRVNEQEVLAVACPESTATWSPIAHGDLLRAVNDAVTSHDLEIASREYSLSAEGHNMFSILNLVTTDTNDFNLAIGLRNSHSKQFAVGACAGKKVTVCDNMLFSGDLVLHRKHTSKLDFYELLAMTGRMISQVIPTLKAFSDWHESLRDNQLIGNDFKALTYDAMVNGAFNAGRFDKFQEAYKIENELYGDNIYSWHGACTRVIKNDSLFQIANRNKALNTTINNHLDNTSVIEAEYTVN